MEEGNVAYPDSRKRYPGDENPSVGGNLQGYIPTYDKDAENIGNLPVISSYDESKPYLNLKSGAFGEESDVCDGNPDNLACMYTSTRELYNLYGTNVFGDFDEYLKGMRINEGSVNDWLDNDPGFYSVDQWRDITSKNNDYSKWGAKQHIPTDKYATGAWFLKDIVLKNKGTEIWSRKDWGAGSDIKTGGSLHSIYKDLRVGDMVTMRRADGTDPYAKNYRTPGYTHEEGVTHSGIIIGTTSDGIPLIMHSWKDKNGGKADGKVKVERMDSLSNNVISSILRHSGVSEKEIKKEEPGAVDGDDIVEEPTVVEEKPKYSTTKFSMPGSFDNMASFMEYFNSDKLDKEDIRGRLNVETGNFKGGDAYNIYDLTDIDIKSWKDVKRTVETIEKEKKRGFKLFNRKKKKETSKLNSGGRIGLYIKR